MKQAIILFLALTALFVFVTTSIADHDTAKPAVLKMSDDEQIALARSAAPSAISKDAAIIIMYDGTPWSHLMIYQDPMLMGK